MWLQRVCPLMPAAMRHMSLNMPVEEVRTAPPSAAAGVGVIFRRRFPRRVLALLALAALFLCGNAMLWLYYEVHGGPGDGGPGPLSNPLGSVSPPTVSTMDDGEVEDPAMFVTEEEQDLPVNKTSDAALMRTAFPAPLSPSYADYNPIPKKPYPDGDPHRGELPPAVRRLLESPPPLVPPTRPPAAPPLPPGVYKYRPWSALRNGSRTSPEDAQYPERQPVERDWRPSDFQWKPPLANLSGRVPGTGRVQHRFENGARFSGRNGDEEAEQRNAERQRLVRNAFIRCWQGYKTHAWGYDELSPSSVLPNNHFNGWGATIVDALDTLLVMGLDREYELARNHVHDVDFNLVLGDRSAYGTADGRVPVFETAIRYLGGLLSAHDLTGDRLMRERAEELAQLILPAFDTLSGLPVGRMQLNDPKNYTREHPRGESERVVLAEAGSMLLEFSRLWQVTGNRTYLDRVQRVTDFFDRNLTQLSVCGTLLSTSLYPESGYLAGSYTIGGMADSYYEYLIKAHQLLGGKLQQYARMYSEAAESILKYLVREVRVVSHAPLMVAGERAGMNHFTPKLEHLACFAGGMFALGARLVPGRSEDLNIARRYTESCYWAYNSTLTGVGPEELTFFRPSDYDRYSIVQLKDGTRRRGAQLGYPFPGVRRMVSTYRNRPETIESVLYMWRTTGDEEWRERGWQMFASWMTHSLKQNGVASLVDVMSVPAESADSMESFAFAETFKYYYLLFAPPDLLSFDDYVYTTEAHPLLVPRNGSWGRAGHASGMPRWRPPPPPPPGEYMGGEQQGRGSMTNVQKHQLAQLIKKQRKQSHRPQD